MSLRSSCTSPAGPASELSGAGEAGGGRGRLGSQKRSQKDEGVNLGAGGAGGADVPRVRAQEGRRADAGAGVGQAVAGAPAQAKERDTGQAKATRPPGRGGRSSGGGWMPAEPSGASGPIRGRRLGTKRFSLRRRVTVGNASSGR